MWKMRELKNHTHTFATFGEKMLIGFHFIPFVWLSNLFYTQISQIFMKIQKTFCLFPHKFQVQVFKSRKNSSRCQIAIYFIFSHLGDSVCGWNQYANERFRFLLVLRQWVFSKIENNLHFQIFSHLLFAFKKNS